MANSLTAPDLIQQIPPPDILRQLLAESIQQADLLRAMLRVARRKAAYRQPTAINTREVVA